MKNNIQNKKIFNKNNLSSVFVAGSKSERGFSLIELMIVIVIITAVSGIAIFNHSQFREQIELNNEVQDLKLNIRQAQIDALGVKSQGGDDFNIGYAVVFDMSNDDRYKIQYFNIDVGFDDLTDIREVQLQNGVKIDSINANVDQPSLMVVFQRPRPGADFFRIDENELSADEISVVLESSRGNFKKKVEVGLFGWISTDEVEVE